MRSSLFSVVIMVLMAGSASAGGARPTYKNFVWAELGQRCADLLRDYGVLKKPAPPPMHTPVGQIVLQTEASETVFHHPAFLIRQDQQKLKEALSTLFEVLVVPLSGDLQNEVFVENRRKFVKSYLEEAQTNINRYTESKSTHRATLISLPVEVSDLDFLSEQIKVYLTPENDYFRIELNMSDLDAEIAKQLFVRVQQRLNQDPQVKVVPNVRKHLIYRIASDTSLQAAIEHIQALGIVLQTKFGLNRTPFQNLQAKLNQQSLLLLFEQRAAAYISDRLIQDRIRLLLKKLPPDELQTRKNLKGFIETFYGAKGNFELERNWPEIGTLGIYKPNSAIEIDQPITIKINGHKMALHLTAPLQTEFTRSGEFIQQTLSPEAPAFVLSLRPLDRQKANSFEYVAEYLPTDEQLDEMMRLIHRGLRDPRAALRFDTPPKP